MDRLPAGDERVKLGERIALIASKGEKGEVRIAYSTFEQFENVRRRLLKSP